MKSFNTLIFVILLAHFNIMNAQDHTNNTQAKIEHTGKVEISIYAKSTNVVPIGTNVLCLFAVSLPGTSNPPYTSLTNTLYLGGTITPQPQEILGGRTMYPFSIEAPSSAIQISNVLPGTLIAKIKFPLSEIGDLVQLNDSGDGSNGAINVYWFISYGGFDQTNLNAMFYGANFSNNYPNPSFAEPGTALPIQLLSFVAEKNGEKNALLNWSTASESNSDYFGIERSYDRINWKTIGQVRAAGNSQIVLNYSYLDKDAYIGKTSNAVAYYRLKMVDLDDSFKYSPIQSVNFGKPTDAIVNSNNFLVYPNPASEGIHVEWDANQVDQPTALEFYDVAGKLIYTEKVEDQTNQHYVDFTQTNIQTGLSLMRVMSGDKAIEYKQIVVGQNH